MTFTLMAILHTKVDTALGLVWPLAQIDDSLAREAKGGYEIAQLHLSRGLIQEEMATAASEGNRSVMRLDPLPFAVSHPIHCADTVLSVPPQQ
ncbi:hypothetical protein D3C71_567780 [compost metagenome]